MSSRLRTVLFFAHECAPYNRPESTVGAQRPAQFAKYLPEFGWRAIVICRDARRSERRGHAARCDIEREARAQLTKADPDSSIVIATQSLAHDGVLDRLWRLVAKDAKGGAVRSLTRKTLTVAKLASGDYSQNWQPSARIASQVVAGLVHIDACVGEHSPDAGLFLARSFSRTYGVPWVADFRDPILQPFRPLVRRLYVPIARRLVATASHTVAVTPVWADLDRGLFRKPATSIPNGFDPDEVTDRQVRDESAPLTISYVGNVIASQDLSIFLDGLALARESLGPDQVQIRFRYRGLMRDAVERLVVQARVSDLSDVGGYVAREEALCEQRNAEYVLLLSIARPEQEDVYYQHGCYPAKTFEYFGAGRPILCVPGDGGMLDALITETKTGVILHTPREIADFLIAAVHAGHDARKRAYQPDERAVAQYSRRALAKRFAAVLDEVAQVLSAPSRSAGSQG